MERNIYLNPLDFKDALVRLESEFPFTGYGEGLGFSREFTETLSTADLPGRVTAAPVTALLSNPNHNAAAMDGICVKAEDTEGADPRNPLELEFPEDFIWIDTGDMVPSGMDAVIMIEDLTEYDDKKAVITAPAAPWQHIRPVGEDVVAGEMIVPSGHRIRPVDMGAIIGGGITHVRVLKQPVVGIIPTGSEIVEKPGEMTPGSILDSNSHMFAAMVSEYGGRAVRYSPVPDNFDHLKKAVNQALEVCDMVILGAGSSAGSEDFSRALIEEAGEVLFHGVSIKPGKTGCFRKSPWKTPDLYTRISCFGLDCF